ncbi:hypothetical protein CQ019_18015 [Arthrobacter sp. MYb229]|nr:hypothetical protein CQ019_18015 [Arthrobacter sp. MYb229]PRB46384.1 hypothetical protein CQ013_18000 [Arthrobacter sp. MYb216]
MALANFSVPISYLHQTGVVLRAIPGLDPISRNLEQYRIYLSTERGLVECSILDNMRVAENFCYRRAFRLAELSTDELTTYIGS